MRRAEHRQFHYIYRITRDDGRFYIGMHSTDDLDDGYFGSGKWITRSINKHGVYPRHTKEILKLISSRQELIDAEREMVNEEMLRDPLCMNLCVGGRWGSLSEESRGKISQANRRRTGLKHSATRNARLSATKLGKKFSVAHRESIGRVKQKPCTVDGETIYSSRGELVAALGTGKTGERSPTFRYVT